MSSIELDLTTLSDIVSRLLAGAEALGGSADGAPTSTPAGVGAAATAAILAHLALNAANVCAALEVSAAGVSESRDTYAANDERTSSALNRMGAR